MPRSRTSHEPIRIREAADGERSILLHPEDDDLFIQTGKQVIAACRLNISLELWLHEVELMLQHVREWAQAHDDRVQACYVTPRPTKLQLFFVPRAGRFDFELADEMARLNRLLLRDYEVGMVEAAQVPLKELDRFMDTKESRQLHAQHE